MRLTERILSFTLLGSEWVLWVLIGLSVLSVAVMVERALFLSGGGIDFDGLTKQLSQFLKAGDVAGARLVLAGLRGAEARVGVAGLEQFGRGSEAISEAMASAKSRARLEMEKNLGVLGTLGNNAPFIGLFGTVLGIIKAFADLSRNQGGGAGAVMSGISEALVATAVGLMVAIPAVIAFNFFQGKVRRVLGRVDAMAHLILAATAQPAAPAAPAVGQ
ncbi:MAG TPA: MotA/TolQ/ExbB proton channel family protein [Polyangia bacterium]|jgi:biopolymer transport protein ExbB|nr:MotA/TolQ/ExbB proton channel family protein [Polyangia bacterium]